VSEPEHEGRGARLFFALEIGEHDRNAIAAWRDEAFREHTELRLVPAASLHVTLAFLGWRPDAEIAAIGQAGLSAVAGLPAPRATPRAVLGVPRSRPRLLALDLGNPDGRSRAVAAALTAALAAAGLHEPEERPFWPHVTLARVRGARGGSRAAATPVRARAEVPLPELVLRRVTLFRSHLSPHGARYEALDACLLPRVD
jgi:2'-5' RNA ligase